jgi:hypothetical protein
VLRKHHNKTFWGEIHVENFLPKKLRLRLREKKASLFFPSIFFIAFFYVSLHDELKNTIKYCLKSDLKISKTVGR